MKTPFFKSSKLVLVAFTLFFLNAQAFAVVPSATDNHAYENAKLKIALQLPDEWQSKVKIEETDNQISFKYINPGGEPVFLLAINKVSETQWIAIKDQYTEAKFLSRKDGNIIYAERTSKSKIKGANNQEFVGIVSKLDEVIQSYKEI